MTALEIEHFQIQSGHRWRYCKARSPTFLRQKTIFQSLENRIRKCKKRRGIIIAVKTKSCRCTIRRGRVPRLLGIQLISPSACESEDIYRTGRTGAVKSPQGESVHAPRGLYKIKGEASSARHMKKFNGVASSVEMNPRTGNIESDHQGRESQSKNERRKRL